MPAALVQEQPTVLTHMLANGRAVDNAMPRREDAVDHVGIVLHAQLEVFHDAEHREVILDRLVHDISKFDQLFVG